MPRTNKPLNDKGGNRPGNRANDRGEKLKVVLLATLGGVFGALLTNAFLFGVVLR